MIPFTHLLYILLKMSILQHSRNMIFYNTYHLLYHDYSLYLNVTYYYFTKTYFFICFLNYGPFFHHNCYITIILNGSNINARQKKSMR